MSACEISLEPSTAGVGAFNRGLVPWSEVELGPIELSTSGSPNDVTYDLDDDGFIGAGDLALFAGSWLLTVPPASAAHDFDCDGQVGPGDLSWFATGWLKFVTDPTILYPPPCQSRAIAQAAPPVQVQVQLVALGTPSDLDTVLAPPESKTAIGSHERFYVEVWATSTGQSARGMTSMYVDFRFPGNAMSVRNVTHTSAFDQFATGAIGAGYVDELGGSALPGLNGVDPQWVRIAVVEMYAQRAQSTMLLELLPGQTGVAAYGRGLVPWDSVKLRGVSLNGPAVPKGRHGAPR